MHRLVVAFLTAALLAGVPHLAGAQQSGPALDPSVAPLPMSQALQQAGFSLSAPEAAYLDAEQQVQGEWILPLVELFSAAGIEGDLDADARARTVAQLQKLQSMDPSAAPAAPANMQRLRELIVEQRQALRRAATAWLNALQAGDSDWRMRGADDFIAAQQAFGTWQQEMINRYPLPEPRSGSN